jgi:predicted N-acetyltransferase YhbS
MNIRPEKVSDYGEIADIHIQAFGNRQDEATLVALLRQRNAYDVDLSLVAEVDGQVVGHVLFTSFNIYFGGEPLPGVCLAPIGVLPDFQKRGIGGELIEAGHKIAEAKGFQMAFLLGHDTYYPRFGYQTGVFADCAVPIHKQHIKSTPAPVITRTPLAEDVNRLREIWLYDQQHVDFALRPERNLNAWLSPNPAFEARVYLQDERIIGYTRGATTKFRMFIADSEASAQAIAHHLLQTHEEITLPLHPNARSMMAFAVQPPQRKGWNAAMLKLLVENATVTRYLNEIANGQRPVGCPIWPQAFDLA